MKLESEIISSLSHPNIIKYKAFLENSETNCRILITEFFDSIPLIDFLSENELTDEDLHFVMSQIVNGLCYLQDQNILHNDFNVKNILIKPQTHDI